MDDSCSMHCGDVNCIQNSDKEDLLKIIHFGVRDEDGDITDVEKQVLG